MHMQRGNRLILIHFNIFFHFFLTLLTPFGATGAVPNRGAGAVPPPANGFTNDAGSEKGGSVKEGLRRRRRRKNAINLNTKHIHKPNLRK